MKRSKKSVLAGIVLAVASITTSLAAANPTEAGGSKTAPTPASSRDNHGNSSGPNNVRLTWMGVTSWLMEVGDLRIIMDGYITRDATQAGGPDEESVKRVIDALGKNKKIDYIFTGHSHFDHSFDTALWAELTGAQIVGARTTCYQAIAQGIPSSQCTVVEGGEVLDLGNGLSSHVVRWNHWGNPADHPFLALLQAPAELKAVPDNTDGLRPGVFEDFPNGGGSRAFLFELEGRRGTELSWFWSSTGEGATFSEETVVVDEAYFDSLGVPHDHLDLVPFSNSEANLMEAMRTAGPSSVDLWIGSSDGSLASQVVPIIEPDAYIQHHWEGTNSSIFDGLRFPYPPAGEFDATLLDYMTSVDIPVIPTLQYMDKFKLGPHGVKEMNNHNVKQKLGLSDIQEF